MDNNPQRLIATHDAGRAVVTHLVAPYGAERAELLATVQIALSAAMAEELFYGDEPTGPSADRAYALTVAAQLAGAAGLVLYPTPVVIADGPRRQVMADLLTSQKAVVRELLETHRDTVTALRDALLQTRIIDVRRPAPRTV